MSPRLTSFLAGVWLAGAAFAAQPFNSATVTRLENKVTVGNLPTGGERNAAVADVIHEHDYLHTQPQSRAELEFPDHSIVRVGQNAVFSFDANSRTLSLQRGAMLFYVPHGAGGGNIKTPSLTAAITGTVGKVSENLIAVLSGELHTPWGVVHAGEAIEYQDGRYRIYKFDADEALTGKLIAWGGPLPELTEIGGVTNPLFQLPDLHWLDVLQWTQVDSQFHFSDLIKPPRGVTVPRPNNQPVDNPPYF